MLSTLDIRKIRCLDGLHYSFGLLSHFYSGLWETCCRIPEDNSQIVPALASCWGFVDALHRIREISQSVPGLSAKHPEMRVFLSVTDLAEDYRHYIQHLRGELAKQPPNTFPVWGSLSWVDPVIPTRSNIAILGAQIQGTNFTGCVYDTVECRWVSTVCLGIDNRSFNFDSIFLAAQRFKAFILPTLVTDASVEVQFHDKLPIVSVDFVTQPSV
ncbi:MAG: hypothetical protein IE917_16305 [Betaproteobacteria bacterium]|nr:hypothetical protein [Betaproteobacteria bacterium]